MACTKCKKKEQREQLERELRKTERPVIIGMIIVGSLFLYGMVELISKIISFF
jgi:hypothetical protein